jgi:phage replication O-like protein O
MPRLPDHISFTMIPNFILDGYLEELSEGEIKILLAIYRKTVGFDKKCDQISYSQFVKQTDLSRSTISQAINSLEKKKLIKVDRSGFINSYTYCIPRIKKAGSSKSELELVRNSNRQPVQNSNTQKKRLKETEINTTTSSTYYSDDLQEVIDYWNDTFPKSLDSSDHKTIEHISRALQQFTLKELKEAIFRRSTCSYYQDNKPHLLNKPNAFFPYPETIANDLTRSSVGIYTYDEMVRRVTASNLTTDDFIKTPDINDKKGHPMWKPKTDHQTNKNIKPQTA